MKTVNGIHSPLKNSHYQSLFRGETSRPSKLMKGGLTELNPIGPLEEPHKSETPMQLNMIQQ